MTGKTNIQITIEKRRALYEREGSPTLLQQVCQIHRLTYREFAAIFNISVGHAENIIKHRTFPSLELGIVIARYFECMVEDLFGWRIDDEGKRCPLLIIDPKTGKAFRALATVVGHKTMELVKQGIEAREAK